MALGEQLLTLVTDLRAEVRRSSSVAVGVEDLPTLKRVINHVYRTLNVDYEWPHLRHVFTKIPMAAGQRYYDFPTNLAYDMVLQAVVWTNTSSVPFERGIDLTDYSTLDPEEDQRQDPPQKWDDHFSGTAVQFEIWPLPASADHSIQFEGQYVLPRLVNDIDQCWLDSELVILFSAAEVLGEDSTDGKIKLNLAQEYLRRLKVRSRTAGKRYQLGLGQREGNFPGATINITPRA